MTKPCSCGTAGKVAAAFLEAYYRLFRPLPRQRPHGREAGRRCPLADCHGGPRGEAREPVKKYHVPSTSKPKRKRLGEVTLPV